MTAYLDGELCGVWPDGVTLFELMQQAGEGLTYFGFDLLELDGDEHRPPAAPRAQKTFGGSLATNSAGIRAPASTATMNTPSTEISIPSSS